MSCHSMWQTFESVALGENQAWPYRALDLHKAGAAKRAVLARVTDVILCRNQAGSRCDSLRRPCNGIVCGRRGTWCESGGKQA